MVYAGSAANSLLVRPPVSSIPSDEAMLCATRTSTLTPRMHQNNAQSLGDTEGGMFPHTRQGCKVSPRHAKSTIQLICNFFLSHLFEPNPRGPCAEPESKAHGRLATRGWKSPRHAACWPGRRPFTPAEGGGWRQGRLARSALRRGDR